MTPAEFIEKWGDCWLDDPQAFKADVASLVDTVVERTSVALSEAVRASIAEQEKSGKWSGNIMIDWPAGERLRALLIEHESEHESDQEEKTDG